MSSLNLGAMITILVLIISFMSTIEVSYGENSAYLGKQKLTHLKLFKHETNNTISTIVEPRHATNTTFGYVNVMDDTLTLGPDASSTFVGRAQGFYASTSLGEFALLEHMNFVFTHGKYEGSSITLLGRSPVFENKWELAVVGGTGVFRFASGYAGVSTYLYDQKSFYDVLEFDIHFVHY